MNPSHLQSHSISIESFLGLVSTGEPSIWQPSVVITIAIVAGVVILGIAALLFRNYKKFGKLTLKWGDRELHAEGGNADPEPPATSERAPDERTPSGGVPTNTVRLVVEANHTYWSLGTANNEPAMFVTVEGMATNIVDRPVTLVKTQHSRGPEEGEILIGRPRPGMDSIFGRYPLVPHRPARFSIHLTVVPAPVEAGERFRTRIYVVDQYGNSHFVGNLWIRFAG